ncbi:MAG: hypothetical protein JSS34_00950 [Proteobacteria bacterium]|nr:hypothetical protein [Pseudomonadota bacterium]
MRRNKITIISLSMIVLGNTFSLFPVDAMKKEAEHRKAALLKTEVMPFFGLDERKTKATSFVKINLEENKIEGTDAPKILEALKSLTPAEKEKVNVEFRFAKEVSPGVKARLLPYADTLDGVYFKVKEGKLKDLLEDREGVAGFTVCRDYSLAWADLEFIESGWRKAPWKRMKEEGYKKAILTGDYAYTWGQGKEAGYNLGEGRKLWERHIPEGIVNIYDPMLSYKIVDDIAKAHPNTGIALTVRNTEDVREKLKLFDAEVLKDNGEVLDVSMPAQGAVNWIDRMSREDYNMHPYFITVSDRVISKRKSRLYLDELFDELDDEGAGE